MYENNYPNNYSNHTAEQNPVNNTTYHYESGGSFSGTNYSAGESKTAGFGGSFGDSAAPGYAECAAGGSGCG